jgi:hypothetical protein
MNFATPASAKVPRKKYSRQTSIEAYDSAMMAILFVFINCLPEKKCFNKNSKVKN